MGAVHMKTKKKVVVLLVLICTIGAISSCSSSSKLAGNWVCEEQHSGYPEQMTLKKDGTGTVEGFSCNWTTKDGTLTLSVGILGSFSYKYKFSGSALYLDEYAYKKQ